MARYSKPSATKPSLAKDSASKAKVKSQYAKTIEADKMQKVTIINHAPLENAKATKNPDAEPVAFDEPSLPLETQDNEAHTTKLEQNAHQQASIGDKLNLEKDVPKQNPPSSPPSKNGSRGGFVLFLSGVIGGIIALLLAALLQNFGLLSPSVKNNTTAINTTSIEAHIAENSGKIAHIATQIAQLEKTSQNTVNLAANDNNASEASAKELQNAVSTLRQDLAALNEKVALLTKNSNREQQDTAQKEMTQHIAAIEQKLATDNAGLLEKTNQNSQAIKNIMANIDGLQNDLQKPIAGKEIAILTAANALKNAVDRGGSYANELQLLQNIAPNITNLDNLQKNAAFGLPNSASLTQEFTLIADKIAATENYASEGAGFGSQIWAQAKGLVTSRPIGNVEGSNPAAIAARMEVAIGKGDYQTALNEWQNLPEVAKNISASFIAKLSAKRDADTLLTHIITIALKANDDKDAPLRAE